MSYRPVSLINVAKMLASCLQLYILRYLIIWINWALCPIGKQDNTIKMIFLIDYAPRHRLPFCPLPLDAEEAFNHLDWQFLGAILVQVGVMADFIKKNEWWHQDNYLLSNEVNILNAIQGFCVGENVHKLCLFVINLLLYVSNLLIAFSSLLQEIAQFGLYSNFQINVWKSQWLNITLSQYDMQTLKTVLRCNILCSIMLSNM